MKYELIQLSDKEKTKRALKGICWHDIEERGDYGGARCIHCGNYEEFPDGKGRPWGWYCPDSPDHQCSYHAERDENGKYFVWTINGEKVFLPKYTVEDAKHESDDWCIFCGQPEERK